MKSTTDFGHIKYVLNLKKEVDILFYQDIGFV